MIFFSLFRKTAATTTKKNVLQHLDAIFFLGGGGGPRLNFFCNPDSSASYTYFPILILPFLYEMPHNYVNCNGQISRPGA